jgi:hypothetical protein
MCDEIILHQSKRACRCRVKARKHQQHECEHRVTWPIHEIIRAQQEHRKHVERVVAQAFAEAAAQEEDDERERT